MFPVSALADKRGVTIRPIRRFRSANPAVLKPPRLRLRNRQPGSFQNRQPDGFETANPAVTKPPTRQCSKPIIRRFRHRQAYGFETAKMAVFKTANPTAAKPEVTKPLSRRLRNRQANGCIYTTAKSAVTRSPSLSAVYMCATCQCVLNASA